MPTTTVYVDLLFFIFLNEILSFITISIELKLQPADDGQLMIDGPTIIGLTVFDTV